MQVAHLVERGNRLEECTLLSREELKAEAQSLRHELVRCAHEGVGEQPVARWRFACGPRGPREVELMCFECVWEGGTRGQEGQVGQTVAHSCLVWMGRWLVGCSDCPSVAARVSSRDRPDQIILHPSPWGMARPNSILQVP